MVALATLMPIVAGVGGNAGTQTLAVTVRAMATNQLTQSNTARAIGREIRVALLNGATIALVVGKTACKVAVENAAHYIAGYALANEVSLAEESFYRPAIKAKCRDGFCPLGELVAVDNVDNLTIITEINGREADSWNTVDLQRSAAELLSALSEFATLNPGDAILIGTPHSRVTLRPGDRVRILAEGFPALENPVVAEGELA